MKFERKSKRIETAFRFVTKSNFTAEDAEGTQRLIIPLRILRVLCGEQVLSSNGFTNSACPCYLPVECPNKSEEVIDGSSLA